MSTMRVSEVFGPTFQGEGPHTGRVVGFLRLGLCNLHCQWCDTPYTWDTTRYDLDVEAPEVDVEEVAARVRALGVTTLVVSGGEPLMHARQLVTLGSFLPELELHVETNGTIAPPPLLQARVAHWSVSPKIGEFGRSDPIKKRLKPGALAVFAGMAHAAFKFVATTTDDLDEIDAVVEVHRLPSSRVWVMPEGVTAAAVTARHRDLAAGILARGYSTSTRLHVLLWDDQRGV